MAGHSRSYTVLLLPVLPDELTSQIRRLIADRTKTTPKRRSDRSMIASWGGSRQRNRAGRDHFQSTEVSLAGQLVSRMHSAYGARSVPFPIPQLPASTDRGSTAVDHGRSQPARETNRCCPIYRRPRTGPLTATSPVALTRQILRIRDGPPRDGNPCRRRRRDSAAEVTSVSTVPRRAWPLAGSMTCRRHQYSR